MTPHESSTRSQPTFFYGWVMVPICLLISIGTAPGQTFGVAAFNDYWIESLGLSRAALGNAYALGTILAAIPMTYVGTLMDKYGPRKILLVVVTLFGLACIGMSGATGWFTLFLSFFLLRLLGQGSMTLLSANTTALWFNKKLGRVTGISSPLMAGAIGLIPKMNVNLIKVWGWRTAYAAWGIALWVLLLPPLIWAFVDRPEHLGQVPDGQKTTPDMANSSSTNTEPKITLAQAVKTLPYWIMFVATGFWAMIGTGIVFNFFDLFASRGLDRDQAANAFLIFSAGLAATHLAGGFLADFLSLRWLLLTSQVLFVGAVLQLIFLSTPGRGVVFAATFGVFQGLFSVVSSTVWVRFYGRAHLGKIRGTITTVMVAFSSLGPFLMGQAHQAFGGYQEVLILFTILPALLIPLTLLLKPPSRA